MTTASTSVATLDLLTALLEAEQGSIFRFMDEGSPYLSHATAEIRGPLQEMVRSSVRHAERLAGLIDSLGGAISPRGIQLEEQYLAFLSVKFLLPKLVEAKKLSIQRYENALRALPHAPSEVISLLQSLLADHRAHLQILEKAAAEMAQTAKPGAQRDE